jgi:hypothetical protein
MFKMNTSRFMVTVDSIGSHYWIDNKEVTVMEYYAKVMENNENSKTDSDDTIKYTFNKENK